MADLGGHVSALFSQRCQPTVPTHTVLGVPAAPRCAHLPRAHDALAGPGRTLGVKTSHHPLATLPFPDGSPMLPVLSAPGPLHLLFPLPGT